jgi:hypothetical protein
MTKYARLRTLKDSGRLPALKPDYAHARPAFGLGPMDPPPRVLLLYGSLRERSFSRLAVEEAARLLQFFGCETRIFDPSDLPLPDQVPGDDHPAVHELREHSLWSEAQVWCSPERHGTITGIMKAQIDHLPLASPLRLRIPAPAGFWSGWRAIPGTRPALMPAALTSLTGSMWSNTTLVRTTALPMGAGGLGRGSPVLPSIPRAARTIPSPSPASRPAAAGACPMRLI